jgi:Zn finger protein HypA/HybF involved in hydrogenase expression
VWHKQCFNCNGCGTTLTSSLVSGFEAPDNEIYCKTCFEKNFGLGSKPLTFSDTKTIKALAGENGCPRCGGAVFEAEKILAGEHVWFHKVLE